MALTLPKTRRRPFLWDLLGQLGLPTTSQAHGSLREQEPTAQAVPVFVSGFPRTGTTTAQQWLADALQYNTCFEPLGTNTTGQDRASFEAVHALFQGPRLEQLSAIQRSGGFPGALHTIGCERERARVRGMLFDHFRAVHAHFGTNCVVKCIRATWNLPVLAEFYRELGVEPVWVMIETNPLAAAYTFYRLGALTECPGIPMPRVASLYGYRVRLAECVGRHQTVRELKCHTAADRLIVASMLEHLEQRHFAQQQGARAIITSLGTLHEHQDSLTRLTGSTLRAPIPALRATSRFQRDRWFHDRVIRELSAEVLEAIEAEYGPVTPDSSPLSRPPFRARFTALRHDLYDASRQAA